MLLQFGHQSDDKLRFTLERFLLECLLLWLKISLHSVFWNKWNWHIAHLLTKDLLRYQFLWVPPQGVWGMAQGSHRIEVWNVMCKDSGLLYFRQSDSTISVNIYDRAVVKNDGFIWSSLYGVGGVALRQCNLVNMFYYLEMFLYF